MTVPTFVSVSRSAGADSLLRASVPRSRYKVFASTWVSSRMDTLTATSSDALDGSHDCVFEGGRANSPRLWEELDGI